MQASIGLLIGADDTMSSGSKAPRKLLLPFALEELEIFGCCTISMWALIRYSDGSTDGDKVYNSISICADSQGNVCVRMKGFSSRVMEREAGSVEAKEALGTLMLQLNWHEEDIVQEVTAPDYDRHLVVLCEPGEISQIDIESCINRVCCLILQSEQESIGKRFHIYALEIFEEIQRILKDKPAGMVLVQIVIPVQGERHLFSGFSGLLKTAQLENPRLIGQLIEVEPGKGSEEIIEILKENSRSPIDNHVRYQNGKRLLAGGSEVEAFQETMKIPWKEQGVYLITGGAGGLGLIFAKEIAHKVKDATLILTGRSLLGVDRKGQLKELESMGARIEYKQVDVTQKMAVTDLVNSIMEDFGSLNGIIHSAGVVRDNFILKKTNDEFIEVLAPKVTGLMNLDQASKDLSLDFFILFSSGAGAFGNPGQADYATANAFMDAYAQYRNQLAALKERQGQTLAINWPLWKDGGMHVDEATEKMMWQSTGMTVMQTTTGIQAFYQGLAIGKDQVMVVEGNLEHMKRKLLSVMTHSVLHPKKASAASDSAGIDTGSLLVKVQTALMQMVSKLLKVKVEDIDADTKLNEYGFDSISLTEFANKLNHEYKLELTPATFFEYPTIHSFSEYLIQEYKVVFAVKFAVQTRTGLPIQVLEGEADEIPSGKRRRSRFARAGALYSTKPDLTASELIAIVGMSGTFPMAKDLQEFWKNLFEGRDCITEIPPNRWDWREYYGDPKTETNKTSIKWGGFIDGVDEFDPLFFGISPREAELMDPQQRLLMTYVWKVIEDAGYSAQSLSGTQTGIFVGTGYGGYSGLISKAKVAIEGYSSTGMVPSVGPNRMSYFLNIHGPSEPVETACSSSLVAIHRAVNAIEMGAVRWR